MCVYMGLLKLRDVEMTQKTKLEIIGPYTPEHEGPFCTRDGRSVRLITKTEGSNEYPVVGFLKNSKAPSCWTDRGFCFVSENEDPIDLMNAREVPVAREFWVNEYPDGGLILFDRFEDARDDVEGCHITRTIHVREVLPGEGA